MTRRRFLECAGWAGGGAVLGVPAFVRAVGANQQLNVGCLGVGNMGRARLKELLHCDVQVVAVCDADDDCLTAAKSVAEKSGVPPKTFRDYRQLLEADLDAVVIAAPDHWHAPMARAALEAGKHVFCEKPLTHTISEARDLRHLAAQNPRLATQMGNQGSASPNLRRAMEVIQAGAIGEVREVHVWPPPSSSFKPGQDYPVGQDPVPAGLRWSDWIGPAPFRPYKKGAYHPKAWRAWYEFGGGSMADWGCHALNLPVRALKLDYPVHIESNIPGRFTDGYPKEVRIQFDFSSRPNLPPVILWWYDGGRRPADGVIPQAVMEHFGATPDNGVLILGENGFTFGPCHPGATYIQLSGEKGLSGLLEHEATKEVPVRLPRSPGHLAEWVGACTGGPATFSDFETGGHLTEIVLAGVVALRMQQPLDWNGREMRATNADAEAFIHAHYRPAWERDFQN